MESKTQKAEAEIEEDKTAIMFKTTFFKHPKPIASLPHSPNWDSL